MTTGAPDLTGFWLVTAAIAGAAWGSFVGVLVDRVPLGRGLGGRSRCDACERTLGARDLVPMVSWIVGRGRCRSCGARVTPLWTAIEVGCAALATSATIAFDEPWTAVLVGAFSGILLGLTVIDLRHRRLPNAIVLPTAVVCAALIVAAAIAGAPLDAVHAALGGVAFGGALLIVEVASRGGMGMGDVKLAGLIGLVVGAVDLASVAVAAGAAILLGGLAAIVALVRGADRRSALPFGPMLAAGALIGLFLGRPIAAAYVGFLR